MSQVPTIRASLVAAAASPQPAPSRARGAAVGSGRRRARPLRLALAATGALAVLAATAVLAAPGGDGTSAGPAALRAAVGHGSVAGADVWSAARAIAATTQRPPGATVSVAWVAALAGTGRPVARLDLAATVERRAMCEWYRYWLAAGPDGRRAARAVIDQIPGWPGVNAGASRRSAVLVAAAVRADEPGPVHAGAASC